MLVWRFRSWWSSARVVQHSFSLMNPGCLLPGPRCVARVAERLSSSLTRRRRLGPGAFPWKRAGRWIRTQRNPWKNTPQHFRKSNPKRAHPVKTSTGISTSVPNPMVDRPPVCLRPGPHPAHRSRPPPNRAPRRSGMIRPYSPQWKIWPIGWRTGRIRWSPTRWSERMFQLSPLRLRSPRLRGQPSWRSV